MRRQRAPTGADDVGAAVGRLDQVPPVAERIAEDGHPPVGFLPRLLQEDDPGLAEARPVPPEIVGVQEQEHPPSGLVADRPALRLPHRLREQDARPATPRRRHQHPPLPLRQRRVLHEREPEPPDEEGEPLVVGGHEQRDGGEGLGHWDGAYERAGAR